MWLIVTSFSGTIQYVSASGAVVEPQDGGSWYIVRTAAASYNANTVTVTDVQAPWLT